MHHSSHLPWAGQQLIGIEGHAICNKVVVSGRGVAPCVCSPHGEGCGEGHTLPRPHGDHPQGNQTCVPRPHPSPWGATQGEQHGSQNPSPCGESNTGPLPLSQCCSKLQLGYRYILAPIHPLGPRAGGIRRDSPCMRSEYRHGQLCGKSLYNTCTLRNTICQPECLLFRLAQ